MDESEKFRREVAKNVETLRDDADLQALSRTWIRHAAEKRYSYNFSWLGRPIIQYPSDIVALQEIIWRVKPDAIVETGIAHGGSLIFSASILALLGGDRTVVGVDIDIRSHNRIAIEQHPLSKHIKLIQGSSTSIEVLDEVKKHVGDRKCVMVILDSNHTHEHVLRELELYSPLVTNGSYLVVFDTIVEDMPESMYLDRPWGKHNNPKSAVHAFLGSNARFQVDRDLEAKLLITAAPDGFLKCVSA